MFVSTLERAHYKLVDNQLASFVFTPFMTKTKQVGTYALLFIEPLVFVVPHW